MNTFPFGILKEDLSLKTYIFIYKNESGDITSRFRDYDQDDHLLELKGRSSKSREN